MVAASSWVCRYYAAPKSCSIYVTWWYVLLHFVAQRTTLRHANSKFDTTAQQRCIDFLRVLVMTRTYLASASLLVRLILGSPNSFYLIAPYSAFPEIALDFCGKLLCFESLIHCVLSTIVESCYGSDLSFLRTKKLAGSPQLRDHKTKPLDIVSLFRPTGSQKVERAVSPGYMLNFREPVTFGMAFSFPATAMFTSHQRSRSFFFPHYASSTQAFLLCCLFYSTNQ
jgi:hypothetical protein